MLTNILHITSEKIKFGKNSVFELVSNRLSLNTELYGHWDKTIQV